MAWLRNLREVFLNSSWPEYTQEEADAVTKVLLSNRVNYWTGTEAREFEKEFAAACDVNHAIAVSNGTVALEVALKALGIGPGDEVVVTPRTFIASASSIVTMGAHPIFADVDRDSQNITASTIQPVLSARTRAIICVHLAGQPCDMDEILDLARKENLKVIEDCAQANGATYKGRSVGSFGHINAWSFCQDKIITTGGEGGMVTTNDKELWSRAWSYKDHGKSWEAVYERQHPPGARLVHETIGINGRMTELQAVLGRIQLRRLPSMRAARERNAERIRKTAESLPLLRVPPVPSGVTHAWYRCYLFVRPEYLAPGWSRDRIIAEIANQNVPCLHGSAPEVYLEKAFSSTGLGPPEFLPIARELGEDSLAFLVHPNLTDIEIARTCAALSEVAHQATAPDVVERSSRIV